MLLERYPVLAVCKDDIDRATGLLIGVYESGGKLLCCGNGGSCADCDHIVGELMKGFLLRREVSGKFEEALERTGARDAAYIASRLQGALPAMSLFSQNGVFSAFANDVEPDLVYAQLVYGYGTPQDALLCISTSGNSKNAVYAAEVAKAKGMKTICLTGERESALSGICDVAIRVPGTETYCIQELHLPVYHELCIRLEKHFFGEK